MVRELPPGVTGPLGLDPTGGQAGLGLDALRKRTRGQLLSAAKSLGLSGVSKLPKEKLAMRVLQAIEAARREAPPTGAAEGAPATAKASEQAAAPEGAAATARDSEPAAMAKLDLGPAGRGEEPVEHIPWSYGVDRVTAAALDPDKLYVYWEVTDPAIERARAALGPGGPAAWLDLRVYDTTGRIFDGTNAHSYFDQRIQRSDRQWFFRIGKPTSTAFVEIGMMSAEGYFAKIGRSGRIDFPRKEPAPWSDPEWMTVRAAGGPVEPAGRGAPSRPVAGETPPPFTPIPLWLLHQSPGEARARELLEGWERVEWHEVAGEGWFELHGQGEWVGPLVHATWEAGPFTYPVEIEGPRREEWEGRTFAYRVGGVTHVVHGPWQVVIRHLGAHQERAVLGRWEIYRTWLAGGGREQHLPARPGHDGVPRPGASELVALGASERWWLLGSELRLGGASEVWRIGASEVRLRGASERLFAGASQWVRAGASERRFAGASERRLAGASERRLAGASERLGASERRLGASEQRLGASERRLDGPDGPSAAPGAYPAARK